MVTRPALCTSLPCSTSPCFSCTDSWTMHLPALCPSRVMLLKLRAARLHLLVNKKHTPTAMVVNPKASEGRAQTAGFPGNQ